MARSKQRQSAAKRRFRRGLENMGKTKYLAKARRRKGTAKKTDFLKSFLRLLCVFAPLREIALFCVKLLYLELAQFRYEALGAVLSFALPIPLLRDVVGQHTVGLIGMDPERLGEIGVECRAIGGDGRL